MPDFNSKTTAAVVIPLYNHEDYIGAAIRSVLDQTLPVTRIVVVDDGSSDRSVEAARAISDPRISVLTQPNRGAHIAQNRGVAEVAGDCEFLAILQSDDAFHPQRMEKCVAFLRQNPQLDVVCTRPVAIDKIGKPFSKNHNKNKWIEKIWSLKRDDLAEWLGIANFTKSSSNHVGRSAYFLTHPFQPYHYAFDYYFAIFAAIEAKLGALDEPLFYYRSHDSNTINSGSRERKSREHLQLNFDLLRNLAPLMASSEEARARYTRYLRMLVHNFVDFRAEGFAVALAQLITQTPPETITTSLANMNAENLPELAAPRNKAAFDELTTKRFLGIKLPRNR